MERKLIEYLPYIVRKYDVFQAITTAEQPEFDTVWQHTEHMRAEQYVVTANDMGLRRWESMLGIFPKDTDTTAYRRDRILARLHEKLPYTLKQLRKMLDALCGKDNYTLYLNDYTLYVSVSIAAKRYFDEVQSLVERVTPQNILLDIQQQYNTWHDVKAQCTYWKTVKTKTWRYVKEENLRV